MLFSSDNPTRLREIFPGACYFPADADPLVSTVCSHAAEVTPGDLFVHLDEFDSTDAEVAQARGAQVVLAERLLPGLHVPQIIVDDSHQACRMLSELEETETTTSAATRIHIAGACGAERTATWLAALHAAAGESVGLLTESCEDDGEVCLPRRRNSRRGADWWSHRCRLGGVSTEVVATTPRLAGGQQPLVACLTSLRCEALDEQGRPAWKSVAAHRRAVLKSLGDLDSAVAVVVNADDPECAKLAATHSGRVLAFGEGDQADVRGMVVHNDAGGQELIVTAGGESVAVALPTPGRAARRDLLAAITTAKALGFSLTQAAADGGLRPTLPLALESLACGQDFAVHLDRAIGPLDLADAIEGATSGGGRTFVAMRLAEDSRVANRQIETAAQMADRVLAYGAVDGLNPLPAEVTVVEDRLAAMAVVLGLADQGDSVLLAGCRDEESDRETATKLLRRRLACEDHRAAA